MDQVVVDTLVDNGWFYSKSSLLKLTRSPLQKFLIDQLELDSAPRLRVGGHAELVAVSAGQCHVTRRLSIVNCLVVSLQGLLLLLNLRQEHLLTNHHRKP